MSLWTMARDRAVDKLVRHKAKMHQVPLDRYTVRIATTVEEYEEAFHLLHVAYVYRGIERIGAPAMRITAQHTLPEATVFVAFEGDKMVGTMTVTLDSPAGLPMDADFAPEMAQLRRAGHRLVEYGSLAVVKRCWHTNVSTLLNMAAAYWSTRVLGASHCIIGVHPRVQHLYRGTYGFQPVGAPKTHHDLTASVQPMLLCFAECQESLRRKVSRPCQNGRSLSDCHFVAPPSCIEIPSHVPPSELARWKLSRDVFQYLFLKKSPTFDLLDPVTRAYLEAVRTRATLYLEETDSRISDVRSILTAPGVGQETQLEERRSAMNDRVWK